MSKLKTRQDVIEAYWPNYLGYCMRSQDSEYREFHKEPTIDGFWKWYIDKGPFGLKHKGLFYNPVDDDRYQQ